MDKVRFGRALGKGTRAAAKSLWEAADAAASPDPRPAVTSAPHSSSASRARNVQSADVQAVAARVLEAHHTVQQTRQHVRGAARQAGKSAFAPVRRVSSVVFLQVTGCFFAMVAGSLGVGLWRVRSLAHADARRYFAFVAVFALFAYFAVSSFVRAARRSRR